MNDADKVEMAKNAGLSANDSVRELVSMLRKAQGVSWRFKQNNPDLPQVADGEISEYLSNIVNQCKTLCRARAELAVFTNGAIGAKFEQAAAQLPNAVLPSALTETENAARRLLCSVGFAVQTILGAVSGSYIESDFWAVPIFGKDLDAANLIEMASSVADWDSNALENQIRAEAARLSIGLTSPENLKKRRVKPDHPVTTWYLQNRHKYSDRKEAVKAWIELHSDKKPSKQLENKLYNDITNDLRKRKPELSDKAQDCQA